MSFIPKSNGNQAQKFKELVNYLKYSGLTIKETYEKNLELLRLNIKSKLQKSLPSFDQILNIYNKIFCLKENVKKYFVKAKLIVIWLISVYECCSNKKLDIFENQDWQYISEFLPNCDSFQLKYKFLKYLSLKNADKKWSSPQDCFLKQIIKGLYPSLFEKYKTSKDVKISWSKVSFELSKELQNIYCFKSERQCKERWLNHLNPFLNKNSWDIDDDIKLMEKNLLKTKKWAIIARDFPGRTQHDIKNRFIHVLNLELGLKREKIRSLLKNNIVLGYIYETVNILKNEKTNINRKNEEDKINEEIDLSESTQNYQSSTIELEEIFEGNHLTDGYTKEDKDFISNELDVFNQFISFY